MRKKTILSTLLCFVMLLLTSVATAVEGASILGVIIDKTTKEPLIGATVVIKGSVTGASTDVEGKYILDGVTPAEYDVEIQYMGYKPTIYHVCVEDSSDLVLNVELEADAVDIASVEVVQTIGGGSEIATSSEQKHAIVAKQVIGAAELSRKGVSDAEGALLKISGVSQKDGVNNVFVRGLGDRYNATSLNGFPIVSEDPEYKNISLDLFSTGIIQSVAVNKAFSALTQSDVAGADIDMRSKEFEGDEGFNVSLSVGSNSQSLTGDILITDGLSAMGYANKAKPSNITDEYGFANALNPTLSSVNIDRSVSLSAGKQFNLFNNPLSIYAMASYDHSYSFNDEIVRNTNTGTTIIRDQDATHSELSSSHKGFLNANYKIGDDVRIDYNFLYIHDNSATVSDYVGYDSGELFAATDEEMGFVRRQQISDNSLIVNQIIAQWDATQRLSVEVGGSYNLMDAEQPDRRVNSYYEKDGRYYPSNGTGANQRFYSALKEDDINTRVLAKYRLSDSSEEASTITVGYRGRIVDNRFNASDYNHTTYNKQSFTLDDFDLDSYFNTEGLQNGDFSVSTLSDSYNVNKSVHSTFVDALLYLSDDFVLNVGTKFDMVTMDFVASLKGGVKTAGSIEQNFLLPSVNLKYDLTDEHSLRLSASKSYTLPQAKELAPYRYVGATFDSQGNGDLKPSGNYNFDLKWEFYPSLSEMVSVAGFYKHIENPISRIENLSNAGGYLTYDNISEIATAAGVELEVRKNIIDIMGVEGNSKRLSVGFNGSYIYTNAKVNVATDSSGSQLEGAAPWIANFDISYIVRSGKRSFTNSLVYNYVSEQIYTIGTAGYRDIMEGSVSTLDFISQAKLNDTLSISFSATNLLNPSFTLSRVGYEGGDATILSSYQSGVSFSLGVSLHF